MPSKTDPQSALQQGMATAFPAGAFYTKANGIYAAGVRYVGECTWYCWGRALEVTNGACKGLPTGNAKTWFQTAKSQGFTFGSEPRPNSIACWNAGTYGHVAFIESITGGIVFSEANWYAVSDGRLSNSKSETPYTPSTGSDGKCKGPIVQGVFQARLPGFQGYVYI